MTVTGQSGIEDLVRECDGETQIEFDKLFEGRKSACTSVQNSDEAVKCLLGADAARNRPYGLPRVLDTERKNYGQMSLGVLLSACEIPNGVHIS